MSKGFIIALAGIATGIAYVFLKPHSDRDHGMPPERHEIRALKAALIQFKAEYSHYPTGDLESVNSALTGNNPKKIKFLDWIRATQDRGNRAIDPWGTPYRVQMTTEHVIVTCAGPDKVFDTADDRSTQ